jgi:diguanylate cyclase
MISIKEYLINFSILITIVYLSGFLYKQFLYNTRERMIEFTLILIAIFAGWCSMAFGIHLSEKVIFDLRFIPVIIATMFSRNLFYIPIIGIGIGLARFTFGLTPASIGGFYIMIFVSIAGILIAWMVRKWRIRVKVSVTVVIMNIVNTVATALFGVIPFDEYMSVIVPTVFPMNIILSFLLLWMVKDLSDEYVNKTNLLNSSRKDPLTQLYNRRALMYYYDHYTTGEMSAYPLSIAFIDIDHFKKVNDQYGHLVGDIVLQKVSELISKNLRNMDIVARYGGEEFVVILPKCDQQEVFRVLERIRKTTEENPIIVNDFAIRITLSAGVATSPEIKANQLLKKADDALLVAKRNGRNQIEPANVNLMNELMMKVPT